MACLYLIHRDASLEQQFHWNTDLMEDHTLLKYLDRQSPFIYFLQFGFL